MTEHPVDLKRLADELARLSPRDRVELLAEVAARSTPGEQGHATWRQLRTLEGIVSVGGNAVEDTEHLYDG